mgnify:CR=1 FL=1
MNKLTVLRRKIDKIDEKIANLLRKRAEKVIEIKKLKKSKKLPVTDYNREREILDKLENDYEKAIFKKILLESRKIQKKDR